MDFNLTEEQLMIQQAARDFAQTELLPGVIERDEHSKFPTEQVKKMAELGFLGMMVDPKYGGSGLDSVSYILAMTEIAKIDASAAVIMSVNNSLVCAGLEKYCNEEQKLKYLVPLAKGDVIHPMQAAFIKNDGFQCGYCTPGQICSAVALLNEAKNGEVSYVTADVRQKPRSLQLSDEEIRERSFQVACL